MEWWQVYLFVLWGNIEVGAVLLLLFFVLYLPVKCGYLRLEMDMEIAEIITKTRRLIIAAWALFFFAILTPSQKELAAIILLPRIVSNADMQAVPDLMGKAARAWLEKFVKEGEGKK